MASPNSQPRWQAKDLPTTATLLSSNTPQQSQCCFCNQQHPSGKCKTLKGADDRKQALRKAGRCFVCLKREHVRECYSKARCSECGGRHQRFICKKVGSNSQGRKSTSPASSSSDQTTTSLNPSANSFQPPTSTFCWGKECCPAAVLLET